jgi:hypothetical protein
MNSLPTPQWVDCEINQQDEPTATTGDSVDDAGVRDGACFLEAGASLAGTFTDAHALAGPGGCRVGGGHGGTTFYRAESYSKNGAVASGNYNHKYDNEMRITRCIGGGSSCVGKVFLDNSRGNPIPGHTFVGQGGDGTAIGQSFPRIAARPFCQDTTIVINAVERAYCYYVYG